MNLNIWCWIFLHNWFWISVRNVYKDFYKANIQTQLCHFTQIPQIVEEQNLTVTGIWKNISKNLLFLGLIFIRHCHSDNKTRILPTNIIQLSNSIPTILDILGGLSTSKGQPSNIGSKKNYSFYLHLFTNVIQHFLCNYLGNFIIWCM